MALRVVGAGLGRTGTMSLQAALQELLGARCYHMLEVIGRPDDIPTWHAAMNGTLPDWDALLADYGAAVDWPAVSFWRELTDHYPDALVLLSVRDADAWWRSASSTIFAAAQQPPSDDPVFAAQLRMVHDMLANTFTPDWRDEAVAKAAYERHNDDVRATIAADRLLEWTPGDGWEPICERLGVAVPSAPFPKMNTTDDFRAMANLDDA